MNSKRFFLLFLAYLLLHFTHPLWGFTNSIASFLKYKSVDNGICVGIAQTAAFKSVLGEGDEFLHMMKRFGYNGDFHNAFSRIDRKNPIFTSKMAGVLDSLDTLVREFKIGNQHPNPEKYLKNRLWQDLHPIKERDPRFEKIIIKEAIIFSQDLKALLSYLYNEDQAVAFMLLGGAHALGLIKNDAREIILVDHDTVTKIDTTDVQKIQDSFHNKNEFVTIFQYSLEELKFTEDEGKKTLEKALKEEGLKYQLLSLAARRGMIEVVEKILATGVNINHNKTGITALGMSMASGNLELIKLLLAQKEIDVNKGSQAGDSPLSIAANFERVEAVKLLLKQKGVKIHQQGFLSRGKSVTALGAAYELENEEIKEAILAVSDPQEVFFKACSNGQVLVLSDILKRNPELDITEKMPFSEEDCLFEAAEHGGHEVVEFLLSREEFDVNSENSRGDTPLLVASKRSGNSKTIELLLTQPNILVNKPNHRLETPIIVAAKNYQDSTIKLLLERDEINLDATDIDGNSYRSLAKSDKSGRYKKFIQTAKDKKAYKVLATECPCISPCTNTEYGETWWCHVTERSFFGKGLPKSCEAYTEESGKFKVFKGSHGLTGTKGSRWRRGCWPEIEAR